MEISWEQISEKWSQLKNKVDSFVPKTIKQNKTFYAMRSVEILSVGTLSASVSLLTKRISPVGAIICGLANLIFLRIMRVGINKMEIEKEIKHGKFFNVTPILLAGVSSYLIVKEMGVNAGYKEGVLITAASISGIIFGKSINNWLGYEEPITLS